jgi:hypothetical protein
MEKLTRQIFPMIGNFLERPGIGKRFRERPKAIAPSDSKPNNCFGQLNNFLSSSRRVLSTAFESNAQVAGARCTIYATLIWITENLQFATTGLHSNWLACLKQSSNKRGWEDAEESVQSSPTSRPILNLTTALWS